MDDSTDEPIKLIKVPQARVQVRLVDEDGKSDEILYGILELMPGGLGAEYYDVRLESGQSLYIGFEDVTDREPPERPAPRRLVLE